MASFRKLKLVSEDELDRLKQRQLEQYNPQLRVMAHVQNQIDNIIRTSNNSLSANERLRVLEMLKKRFTEMSKTRAVEEKTPTDDDEEMADTPHEGPEEGDVVAEPSAIAAVAVKDESSEEKIAPIKPDPNVSKAILSAVSSRNRKDAENILSEMNKNPSLLSYNAEFEVVINGVPILDSNIIDILKSHYSSSTKAAKAFGYNRFQNVLAHLDLIKESTSSSVTTRAQSSSSSSLPPGTLPEIKRVYND